MFRQQFSRHFHHRQQLLSQSQQISTERAQLRRVTIIKGSDEMQAAVIGIGVLFFAIVIMCVCVCLPVSAPQTPQSENASESTQRSSVEPTSQRWPVTLIAIVAASPALIDGVHFSIASGILLRLDPHEELHLAMRACVVGAFQLGQLISCLIGPYFLDGIGRKRSLQVFACGQFAALCVMAAWARAESLWVLIAARLLTGIFFGQTIAPVYISETAPYRRRGSLVMWVEILTGFGGLLAMVMHLVLIEYPLWYQYVFYAALSFVVCVGVTLLPHEGKQPSLSDHQTGEGFCPPTKAGRLGLYIACLLAFFQQCSGDEAIFGYCNQIAHRAGLERPMLFSLALATLFFLNNLIASGIIDKIGRRVIIIGGMLCMSLCWTSAGTSLLLSAGALVVLFFVLAYGFFSSLTLGPAYFVVASEVLPDAYRAKGLSASMFVSRLTACTAVLTFELKNMLITLAGTFFVYAVIMLLGAIYMYFRLPETAGRKFSEIQNDLNHYAGLDADSDK